MTDSFQCSTRLQRFRQMLQLLPRGKAWQTGEPAGQAYTVTMAQPGFAQTGLFQTLDRPLTVMHAFFSAAADFFSQLEQMLCALRLEFWCATQTQTNDLWLAEYGLPDACDPFPNLCAKVGAFGGTRCDYFSAVAAQAGWSISCDNVFSAICAMFGTYQLGEVGLGGQGGAATIQVTVRLSESPAYQGRIETLPQLGAFQLGGLLTCAPDISPLICLLDRIVPAHVAVNYLTEN
jgi:hypothetical protein